MQEFVQHLINIDIQILTAQAALALNLPLCEVCEAD